MATLGCLGGSLDLVSARGMAWMAASATIGTLAVFAFASGPSHTQAPPPELRALLASKTYSGWQAASVTPRPSKSSHPAFVRVFVNPPLATSLKSPTPPAREHPQGAIAVKEIYDAKGERSGWAAMHKVEAKSRVGQGWMWIEMAVDGTVRTEGLGVRTCVGCHAPGDDFVMSKVAP